MDPPEVYYVVRADWSRPPSELVQLSEDATWKLQVLGRSFNFWAKLRLPWCP